MNLAAFAVITARERETGLGDDISLAVRPRRATGRWLAWPMTIAMLALAGFPATAGFFGKLYLINAAVDNGYAWLGIVIVLGSAVSLAYYLRVVAAVWMRSPVRGAVAARGVAVAGRRPVMARRLGRGRRRGAARPRIAEPRRGARLAPARGRRSSRWSARWRRSFFGIYPEPLFDVAQRRRRGSGEPAVAIARGDAALVVRWGETRRARL